MMADLKMGVIPFVILVSIPILLLMLQPDFGSILILAPIILALYFVGNGNLKFLWIVSVGLFLIALTIYGIGKTQMESLRQAELTGTKVEWSAIIKVWYIAQRIDNFFRPNKEIASTRSSEKRDDQLRNAFVAMGSGGFFGLWFGKSIQKFWYLPEVEGDFIFSVIVEELWFVGGFIVISFYLFIAYRGYTISRSVKDLFGKYLAFGITTWFVVQAFVNIGVNLNVVPLTGVTLPFISYGGTSVISLAIASGILLSISRHVEVKPQNLSEALQSGRKVIF